MTLKSILEFEKKHIRVKLYGKPIGVVSFFMKNTTCGGAYSPKNLPAAAGEPPRRSCFALGGCSRFSGDLTLRHSAHLCLAHALRVVVVEFYYSTKNDLRSRDKHPHTLPRRRSAGNLAPVLRSRQGEGGCSTIHPPVEFRLFSEPQRFTKFGTFPVFLLSLVTKKCLQLIYTVKSG